jgi:hypothetical protein
LPDGPTLRTPDAERGALEPARDAVEPPREPPELPRAPLDLPGVPPEVPPEVLRGNPLLLSKPDEWVLDGP